MGSILLAVEADLNEHFALFIIDLILSGKDGWQLLSEILANPDTQAVPCIAVTAFHNSKLREDALKAGFTAYLPKPLDTTRLARAIEDIL
ncbi:MAG: response regulator [Aggregatilineales bacterium]